MTEADNDEERERERESDHVVFFPSQHKIFQRVYITRFHETHIVWKVTVIVYESIQGESSVCVIIQHGSSLHDYCVRYMLFHCTPF